MCFWNAFSALVAIMVLATSKPDLEVAQLTRCDSFTGTALVGPHPPSCPPPPPPLAPFMGMFLLLCLSTLARTPLGHTKGRPCACTCEPSWTRVQQTSEGLYSLSLMHRNCSGQPSYICLRLGLIVAHLRAVVMLLVVSMLGLKQQGQPMTTDPALCGFC